MKLRIFKTVWYKKSQVLLSSLLFSSVVQCFAANSHEWFYYFIVFLISNDLVDDPCHFMTTPMGFAWFLAQADRSETNAKGLGTECFRNVPAPVVETRRSCFVSENMIMLPGWSEKCKRRHE